MKRLLCNFNEIDCGEYLCRACAWGRGSLYCSLFGQARDLPALLPRKGYERCAACLAAEERAKALEDS
jgi:hypothetical protein